MGIKSRADAWAVSARREHDVTVFAVIAAAMLFAALGIAAVTGKIDGLALIAAIALCVAAAVQFGRRGAAR